MPFTRVRMLLAVWVACCLASQKVNGGDDLPFGQMESSAVHVEVVENVSLSWPVDSDHVTDQFSRPVFALSGVPHKYSKTAVREDRSEVFLVRLTGKILLSEGRHTFLLRSMNSAHVRVDQRSLARTRFIKRNADGHEPVPDVPQARVHGMRRLPVGHAETMFTLETDGGTHVVVVEAFVGGKKLRPELGELSLSIQSEDGMFYVAAPHPDHRIALTDDEWEQYVAASSDQLSHESLVRRRESDARNREYWAWRHAQARRILAAQPPCEVPEPINGMPSNGPIDDFGESTFGRTRPGTQPPDKRPGLSSSIDVGHRRDRSLAGGGRGVSGG